MRRSLAISAAAVALTLPAFADAAPRQITVGDDFFAPKRPPARNFASGPSFRWTNGGGTLNPHNIRQDAKLFSSGRRTAGPINYAINASAGSYGYYCTFHGTPQLGMRGVVKVRPIAETDSLIGEIEVLWASSATDTGSRFDVRYRVDQRRWKTWKNDTPRFHGRLRPQRPARSTTGPTATPTRSRCARSAGGSRSAATGPRPSHSERSAAPQRSLRSVRAPTRSRGRPPSRSAFSRWPLRP